MMNNQNLPQLATASPSNNQSPKAAPLQTSTTLFNDPIFEAIHDAFSLGWSIVELKSRLQITACNLSLDGVELLADQTLLARVINYTSPGVGTSQPDCVDAVLQDSVFKGVVARLANHTDSLATILAGDDNTPAAPATTPAPQSAPTDLLSWSPELGAQLRTNTEQLASVLRSLFKLIAQQHITRFPNSTTAGTLYDIQETAPTNDAGNYAATPLSYDFLSDTSADIGIKKIDGLDDFKLYDTLRRTLNCLTVLLTLPEECLEPATVKDYQQKLLPKVLTSSNILDASDQVRAAVKLLSDFAIRLLDAWDGFLRESYYVDDAGSDPDMPNYEVELIAYEAGRSLAGLSWRVSVALGPLENFVKVAQQSKVAEQFHKPLLDLAICAPDPAATQALQNTTIGKVLSKKVQDVWYRIFNEHDIDQLQHQITSLSTALDEAYYRVNKNIRPVSADDPLAFNPALPSQGLQAVKQSLDYWERAVILMCQKTQPLLNMVPADKMKQRNTPPVGRAAGAAAITPTAPAAPAALPTTSANMDLRPEHPLDWELSQTLRSELIQQASVWESLVLCKQNLQAFTAERVTQQIINDFMYEFEQTASDELQNIGKRTSGWMIGIGAFVAVFIVIFVLLNVFPNTIADQLKSPFALLIVVGGGLAAFVNSVMGRLGSIGSIFGPASTTIAEAFQQGNERIRIEFQYLNHNIAVTYPLIEFFAAQEIAFIVQGETKAIANGYDFLVYVFWTAKDRDDEVQRVARAAFGPVGAFVGARLEIASKSVK